MEHKNVQKWTLITIGIIGLIIIAQIAVKLLRTSTKVAETTVNVSAVTAALSDISEKVVLQGVAQGDPQVKVYPMVPGKFARIEAKEGSYVTKDQPIVLIDRDIPGMDFQLAPVKSPIDGIVTKIYYSDKGASVSPQYPVAEVTNPGSVKVVMAVGEEEMSKVKAGMEAFIRPLYGSDGTPVKAYVYSTTPYIDSDTLSGTIIVKGDNSKKAITPGSSVEVSVLTGKRKAIMLPESAVLMGEEKNYVFVNDNGKAKRVDIETGYMEGDSIEAKSGLNGGEQVITEGNFKLNEGSKIEAQSPEPKAQGK